jgi:DNA-binding IscR family transcriptional regulator
MQNPCVVASQAQMDKVLRHFQKFVGIKMKSQQVAAATNISHRYVTAAIAQLREEGVLICSSDGRGGYWLGGTDEEVIATFEAIIKRGKNTLCSGNGMRRSFNAGRRD